MSDPTGSAPRLFDLGVEWLLQYAGESTLFGPSADPRRADRLGQLDGYLSATEAAVVFVGPAPGSEGDLLPRLGDWLARVEAEFAGRLLIGPDDLGRWEADGRRGLTWAVVGVRGALGLAESGAGRLIELFDRGVRAFRLSASIDGRSIDDAGLGDAGRAALEALAGLDSAPRTPGVLIDLAGLGPSAAGEVLDWLEGRGEAGRLVVPIVSLGWPGASTEVVRRLRALGGLIGVGPRGEAVPDAEALRRWIDAIAAEPILGRPRYAGIAIGTGFLGLDVPDDGLGSAEALLDAIAGSFDPEAAERLARGNARALCGRLIGGGAPGSGLAEIGSPGLRNLEDREAEPPPAK